MTEHISEAMIEALASGRDDLLSISESEHCASCTDCSRMVREARLTRNDLSLAFRDDSVARSELGFDEALLVRRVLAEASNASPRAIAIPRSVWIVATSVAGVGALGTLATNGAPQFRVSTFITFLSLVREATMTMVSSFGFGVSSAALLCLSAFSIWRASRQNAPVRFESKGSFR